MSAKGVKFLFDNYVARDILANYSVSSELAAFPVLNAFNLNRVSKVWRSNGYFKITASNNGLVFRESAGVDLLAELTADEYNSTADFLAELKASLEAVGAATYTVTQTSDKKISIASSGGFFEIRGADVLSTLIPVIGFDTSNVYTGATSYVADLIRIHTSEWIKWDMGMASRPNAFAMKSSHAYPIKLSPSSSVILRGNPTDPEDWTGSTFEEEIAHDDEVMGRITEEDFLTDGARFWRLDFTDIDNAYGYIEMGAIFLGRWWSPDSGCAQFPLTNGFIDRTQTEYSEAGQGFSNKKPISQRFDVAFNFLDKMENEELEFWFQKFGTGNPFFVSLDSNEQFSSTFNRKLKYCKFAQDVATQLYAPNKFNLPISLLEQL